MMIAFDIGKSELLNAIAARLGGHVRISMIRGAPSN
jgi:hypothetical protein